MHELSVAESIFRLAEEKIGEYPDKKPVKIKLDIGILSGIDFDALDFAITSVIKNTPFEQTAVEITRILPKAVCKECGCEFDPVDYLSNCPQCGNFQIEIIAGKELIIKSIELEDIE
jgi:hydrogenase nickel incorporation protein HypA/HybF